MDTARGETPAGRRVGVLRRYGLAVVGLLAVADEVEALAFGVAVHPEADGHVDQRVGDEGYDA